MVCKHRPSGQTGAGHQEEQQPNRPGESKKTLLEKKSERGSGVYGRK